MARLYNGTSDLIDCGVSTAIAATNNFTWACWVRTSSTSTQDFIASRWHYPDSGLLLGMNANGRLRQYWSGGGGAVVDDDGSSGSTINDGNWHHLGYQWASGISNFYIDGTFNFSFNGSGTAALISYGTYHLIIGRDSGGADEYWSGDIAEVGFWNVVLTANEIYALAKGQRPKNIRPSSLAAYYPLFGLQSPEPDLSGNANNGTLTGTAFATHPPITTFTTKAVSQPLLSVATSFTITGPATGRTNIESAVFTVTPNGITTGTFTPSDPAGVVFNPATLSWVNSDEPQTFTAKSPFAITYGINGSFSNGLTAPSDVMFDVASSIEPPFSSAEVTGQSLTWNGVGLNLDHLDLYTKLINTPLSDIRVISKPLPESPAMWGVGGWNYSGRPDIKIGVVYFPSGAVPFGEAHFVISQSTYDQIAPHIGSGTLVLQQETGTVTFENWTLLPPQPLFGSDSCFLMSLVDARFFWSKIPVPSIDVSTWQTALDDVTAVLNIDDITINPSEFYGSPHPDFFTQQYEQAGELLDSILWNVGLLLVSNFDGTFDAQTPDEAITSADNSRTVAMVGGDAFDKNINGNTVVDNSLIPSSVIVTFPQRLTTGEYINAQINHIPYSYNQGDLYQITINTGGTAPVCVIHDTAEAWYFVQGDDVTNGGQLMELAQLIADNYVDTLTSGLWEVYASIISFEPTGLHDLQFIWQSSRVTTQVCRRAWNPYFGELKHHNGSITGGYDPVTTPCSQTCFPPVKTPPTSGIVYGCTSGSSGTSGCVNAYCQPCSSLTLSSVYTLSVTGLTGCCSVLNGSSWLLYYNGGNSCSWSASKWVDMTCCGCGAGPAWSIAITPGYVKQNFQVAPSWSIAAADSLLNVTGYQMNCGGVITFTVVGSFKCQGGTGGCSYTGSIIATPLVSCPPPPTSGSVPSTCTSGSCPPICDLCACLPYTFQVDLAGFSNSALNLGDTTFNSSGLCEWQTTASSGMLLSYGINGWLFTANTVTSAGLPCGFCQNDSVGTPATWSCNLTSGFTDPCFLSLNKEWVMTQDPTAGNTCGWSAGLPGPQGLSLTLSQNQQSFNIFGGGTNNCNPTYFFYTPSSYVTNCCAPITFDYSYQRQLVAGKMPTGNYPTSIVMTPSSCTSGSQAIVYGSTDPCCATLNLSPITYTGTAPSILAFVPQTPCDNCPSTIPVTSGCCCPTLPTMVCGQITLVDGTCACFSGSQTFTMMYQGGCDECVWMSENIDFGTCMGINQIVMNFEWACQYPYDDPSTFELIVSIFDPVTGFVCQCVSQPGCCDCGLYPVLYNCTTGVFHYTFEMGCGYDAHCGCIVAGLTFDVVIMGCS